jgi:hypothetical protein
MAHITDEPQGGGLVNPWRIMLWVIVLLIICLGFSWYFSGKLVEPYRHPQVQCQSCGFLKCEYYPYNSSFEETLELIQKNCGSTYLTKKWRDPEWYVFTKVCRGEYCKSEYVPLQNCLKKT